jgi:hypothetical protein
MDAKTHWERVYTTKEPEAVSWYRPHLETSLELVERSAHSHSASIIDTGRASPPLAGIGQRNTLVITAAFVMGWMVKPQVCLSPIKCRLLCPRFPRKMCKITRMVS